MAPPVTRSTLGARSPTGDGYFPNESLPEVDADRIGVWGTSHAGGHVLVLAAVRPQDPGRRRAGADDQRLSAGCAAPPDAVTALEHLFDDDERAQFRGEPPRRHQVVGDDPSVPAFYRSGDAISSISGRRPGAWMNEVTHQAVLPGW